MRVREGGLSLVLSLCAVTGALAQTSAPLASRPLSFPGFSNAIDIASDQQVAVLNRWVHDYQQWRAWYLQWRNRPEPGWFSTRGRRVRPDPPPWLAAFCAERGELSGTAADACAALHEWQADDMAATLMTERIAQTRAATESPSNTRWWERVHVDAMWPMTRTGSSAFGVAGVHSTVHVTKRLQVFLTPGFILMRVPGLDGAPTWGTATDWGFSYGLFDVRVPLAHRPGTVHLNMARIWMIGNSNIATTGEMYLAGLSLSFKQR